MAHKKPRSQVTLGILFWLSPWERNWKTHRKGKGFLHEGNMWARPTGSIMLYAGKGRFWGPRLRTVQW